MTKLLSIIPVLVALGGFQWSQSAASFRPERQLPQKPSGWFQSKPQPKTPQAVSPYWGTLGSTFISPSQIRLLNVTQNVLWKVIPDYLIAQFGISQGRDLQSGPVFEGLLEITRAPPWCFGCIRRSRKFRYSLGESRSADQLHDPGSSVYVPPKDLRESLQSNQDSTIFSVWVCTRTGYDIDQFTEAMDHVLFYFLSQQDKEENKIYTEVDLRKKLIILALHRKYCGDESAPSLDGEAASSFSFDTFDRWRGENLQFTADRSDEDDVSELTLLEDERINDAGPLENSEAAPPMCKPHSLPDLHVFDKKDEVDGQQDDKEDISE